MKAIIMGVVLVDCWEVPEQHAYLCIQLNEVITELTSTNYSFVEASSIVLHPFEMTKTLKTAIKKSTLIIRIQN